MLRWYGCCISPFFLFTTWNSDLGCSPWALTQESPNRASGCSHYTHKKKIKTQFILYTLTRHVQDTGSDRLPRTRPV
jgi:hypothetical protein